MAPLLLIPSLFLAAAMATPDQRIGEDELVDFEYVWPASLDEEEALGDLLRADREAERAQALDYARAEHSDPGRAPDFRPHFYEKSWGVAGRSDRLLSLSASRETYTGGAHGNFDYDAWLWDLGRGRRVGPDELLGREAASGLNARLCERLDQERETRRREKVVRSEEWPDQCPPLTEQALAFLDEDEDARFDRLQVLIPPYVAGPWAEGPFVMEIPFGRPDLCVLPEEYRSSFEPAAGETDQEDCPRSAVEGN